MHLFAKDRVTGQLPVPGHEGRWVIFHGLPGRKLERAKYASMDAAVAASGGAEAFKARMALFVKDLGGEEEARKKAKRNREAVISMYDACALGEMGIAEWNLVDASEAVMPPTEANIDELPDDIRLWIAENVLQMNGVIGPEADQGNA